MKLYLIKLKYDYYKFIHSIKKLIHKIRKELL